MNNQLPQTIEERFTTKLLGLEASLIALKANQIPNFQYVYSSSGSVNTYDGSGFAPLGFWNAGGELAAPIVSCAIFVPSGVVVSSASMILRVAPTYLQTEAEGSYAWVQAQELKLFKNSQTIYLASPFAGEPSVVYSSGTDISSATLGAASWSPTVNGNVQEKVADITSYVSPGDKTAFYLQTGSTYSGGVNDENSNHAIAKLFIVIQAYLTT